MLLFRRSVTCLNQQDHNLKKSKEDAEYYRIQIEKHSAFVGVSYTWDSGKTALDTPCLDNLECEAIAYGGSDPDSFPFAYRWRIKFWNTLDNEGAWSTEEAYFACKHDCEGAKSAIKHKCYSGVHLVD